MRALIATVLLLASACASTGTPGKPLSFAPPPTSPAGPFKALGTLQSWSNSVSYDAQRIVGPRVDIELQNGTEWAGSVYGHSVRLTVGKGELAGMDDRLVLTRDGDTVRVDGSWAREHVVIELTKAHLLFRNGRRLYDLAVKAPGCLGEKEREGCVVKAIGDAERLTDATMPQFVLALIAAFPTADTTR